MTQATSVPLPPLTLAELQAMPQASLLQPQDTAELYLLALFRYTLDQASGLEMIEWLRGPACLTAYHKQFLRDRLQHKPYVVRSYFVGATPANNYTPASPLQLLGWQTNSASPMGENQLKLFLCSSGADSPRPLILRQKPSTGEWFVWEDLLLADIRRPAAEDPWA